MPSVTWNPWVDLREREDVARLNLSFPFGVIPDWFQKYVLQSYYASVTYVDDLVGEVLDALEKQSLRNNTIVTLLGDHGWSLGEHGEWSKYSNFDVALRVPWIVSLPSTNNFNYLTPFDARNYIRRHKRIELNKIPELVELVDVFPTLAELAGMPIPMCPNDST